MKNSIIITGAGGQGTLLAAKIIGTAAMIKGWDVKASEAHGMSQRGGSVTTYVKYSADKVYSQVVTINADIVLAFELLEGYRASQFLKKGGLIITSTQTIDPMPVIAGFTEYPENIQDKYKASGVNALCVDALSLAEKAGSQKCANVVLIGALAARTKDIAKDIWLEALNETAPADLLKVNINAFEIGYGL